MDKIANYLHYFTSRNCNFSGTINCFRIAVIYLKGEITYYDNSKTIYGA